MPNQGGLVYQEYSHIVPSIRMVSIIGQPPGTAVPVPGAAQGDILLGVIRLDLIVTTLDLLEDALFVNGALEFQTIDPEDVPLIVLYFDADAVLD